MQLPDSILRAPALMVVAHPDDETIWGGGLIALHPQWNWTIMSLCRGDDPDRAPKFDRVCGLLNARGIMECLDDSPKLKRIHPEIDIGKKIIEAVGATHWSLCVTHGSNGEYGHQRHVDVHDEVIHLVDAGDLVCDECWTFSYDAIVETGDCSPREETDIELRLNASQLRAKRNLIENVYGYQAGSFESEACIAGESFRRYH